MKFPIAILRDREDYCRKASVATDSGGRQYSGLIQEASECAAALSILRSFPQSGEDEPETGETLPPPPMEGDPRYLKLLVLVLTSNLRGIATENVLQDVVRDAGEAFNTLFPKP